jgi:hypothetical protein
MNGLIADKTVSFNLNYLVKKGSNITLFKRGKAG